MTQRLVELEQVAAAEHHQRQCQPGTLAAGELTGRSYRGATVDQTFVEFVARLDAGKPRRAADQVDCRLVQVDRVLIPSQSTGNHTGAQPDDA